MGFELEGYFLYAALALVICVFLTASALLYFKFIERLREKARMGF